MSIFRRIIQSEKKKLLSSAVKVGDFRKGFADRGRFGFCQDWR